MNHLGSLAKQQVLFAIDALVIVAGRSAETEGTIGLRRSTHQIEGATESGGASPGQLTSCLQLIPAQTRDASPADATLQLSRVVTIAARLLTQGLSAPSHALLEHMPHILLPCINEALQILTKPVEGNPRQHHEGLRGGEGEDAEYAAAIGQEARASVSAAFSLVLGLQGMMSSKETRDSLWQADARLLVAFAQAVLRLLVAVGSSASLAGMDGHDLPPGALVAAELCSSPEGGVAMAACASILAVICSAGAPGVGLPDDMDPM